MKKGTDELSAKLTARTVPSDVSDPIVPSLAIATGSDLSSTSNLAERHTSSVENLDVRGSGLMQRGQDLASPPSIKHNSHELSSTEVLADCMATKRPLDSVSPSEILQVDSDEELVHEHVRVRQSTAAATSLRGSEARSGSLYRNGSSSVNYQVETTSTAQPLQDDVQTRASYCEPTRFRDTEATKPFQTLEDFDPDYLSGLDSSVLEARTFEASNSEQNSQTKVDIQRELNLSNAVWTSPDTKYILFHHQHGHDLPNDELACCWPQVAMKVLEASSLDNAMHIDVRSITPPQGCLKSATTEIATPKATVILETAVNIACFGIDTTRIDDQRTLVTGLIRFSNFLLAASLFEDCFLWSLVLLELLPIYYDSMILNTPQDSSESPLWVIIFMNMLKSCTGPEHLQLIARSLKQIRYLGFHTTHVPTSQIELLHAFLGQVIERFSDAECASYAARGCWAMLHQASTENPLMRKLILSARNPTSDERLAQLKLYATTRQDYHAENNELKNRLRIILDWCKHSLHQRSFSESMASIDNAFWSSTITPFDKARFEQVAVFSYLCQALWRSKQDKRPSPLWDHNLDFGGTFRDIASSGGLPQEAAIAVILNIDHLSSHSGIGRVSLSARYQTMITQLCDHATRVGTGFMSWAPTTGIDRLSGSCRWASKVEFLPSHFENAIYAKKVGTFLRESASHAFGLSSLQSLQPILHQLHFGEPFIGQTMLPLTARSPLASQMSLERRMFKDMADRLKRSSQKSSSSSWISAKVDSGDFTSEILDYRMRLRNSTSTRSSDRMSFSMASVRDSLRDSVSISDNHNQRHSTLTSQSEIGNLTESQIRGRLLSLPDGTRNLLHAYRNLQDANVVKGDVLLESVERDLVDFIAEQKKLRGRAFASVGLHVDTRSNASWT